MKLRAKNGLKSLLVIPAILAGLAIFALPAGATPGTCPSTDVTTGNPIQNGINCGAPSTAPASLFGATGVFTIVINAILFVIGMIAVVYLILGAIHYVTSGGDAASINKAKNTILYAIIGVVVAFMAYAIVNFVVSQFTKATYVPTQNILEHVAAILR